MALVKPYNILVSTYKRASYPCKVPKHENDHQALLSKHISEGNESSSNQGESQKANLFQTNWDHCHLQLSEVTELPGSHTEL